MKKGKRKKEELRGTKLGLCGKIRVMKSNYLPFTHEYNPATGFTYDAVIMTV